MKITHILLFISYIWYCIISGLVLKKSKNETTNSKRNTIGI